MTIFSGGTLIEYSAGELEKDLPNIDPVEQIDRIIGNYRCADGKTMDDEVVPNVTFEELTATLLKAKEELVLARGYM